MKLKQQIFRGSFWIFIGNGGQQAVSFFLFVYLARLLSPVDFGVMALASVVMDFIVEGGRFGQTETLQRSMTADESVESTSFWLLQMIGFALTAVIILLAKPLAAAASMPLLEHVLYLLAPVGLIQNIGAVHDARLRRQFRYGALAARNVLATASGGIVAVWLARHGRGVESLAVQRLVFSSVMTAAVWIASGWRPSFTFNKAAVPALVRSGRHIVLSTLIGMSNPRIVDAMVGFFLGAYWLGYLKLAWRAFDFIGQFAVQPITTVALSTFSRLQHDRAALTRAYLRMTQIVAFALVPVFAGLAVLAPEFVPLVFGEKWKPSVLLLQLFAIMSITAPINYFFSPTMNAMGATRVILRQGVLQLVLTIVFTAIAAQWGIVAVVVAHILRGFLASAYNLIALKRYVGFAPKAVFVRLLPIGASVVGMIAVVAGVKFLLSVHGWLLVLIAALAGVVAYFSILFAGDFLRWWPGYMAQLRITVIEAIGKPAWMRKKTS